MGWGSCGTDSRGRKIGYAHAARCDHKGCKERIDRGLAYACGGMHGTGEGGCEGYFCGKHLYHVEDPDGRLHSAQLCEACKNDWNAYLVEDLIEQAKELEARTVTGITTPTQLAHIRATVAITVEDWLRDYGIPEGKEHPQLVNRVVAAMVAMHEAGVIEVKLIEEQQPPDGKGGV